MDKSSEIEWANGKLSVDEVRSFTGRKYDYYWLKWKALSEHGSKVSANFFAAFFGVGWLAYRKMHKWVIVCILFSLTTSVVFGFSMQGPDTNSSLMGAFIAVLGIFFALLFLGNYLYRQSALATTKSARAVHPNDPNQQLRLIERRGGTSVVATVLWTLAYTVIVLGGVGLSNDISKRMEGNKIVRTLFPADYFVETRFHNPHAMRMIVANQHRSMRSLDSNTRQIFTHYIVAQSEQVRASCGQFLPQTSVNKIKDFTITSGLKALKTPGAQGETSTLGQLFLKFGGLVNIHQKAKADARRLIHDFGGCSSRQFLAFRDGTLLFIDKFEF